MASAAKRAKLSKTYNTEDVLRLALKDNESGDVDSEHKGISSGEKIDCQL